MIMRWPNGGLKGGKKLNDLVTHVDMLPTLASLTGINFTPKKKLDGINVSSYFLGEGNIPDRFMVTDTQFNQWPQKGKRSCVMKGTWRLVNGNELYDVSQDPGQENNLAAQYPEKVQEMNAQYDLWWNDVISETKFSTIPLGLSGVTEVLYSYDAHSGNELPVWNQKFVREAKAMAPSPFYVDFIESGKYKFTLRRWPKESGLALGEAATDTQEETPWFDGVIKGKALQFAKAHVTVGDKKAEADVDNTATGASIEMEVTSGENQLTAWFDTKDGDKLHAYYLEVEKLD